MRSLCARIALAGLLSGCSPAAGQDTPACGAYLYRADITRVIDGDTVVADIDLGFRTWRRGEHLRLYGIDAPETSTAAGRKAAETLRARLEAKRVFVCTIKDKREDKEARGSFGRYLAVLYESGTDINAWMLETGHAVRYLK